MWIDVDSTVKGVYGDQEGAEHFFALDEDFPPPQGDVLVVEGCGGLRVPLSSPPAGRHAYDVRDLCGGLALPVVVVARPSLGTLNLTALTVESARAGGPRRPRPALRRRAAAIRGFYRFAFGEGLIGVDIAAHLDLPRQPRLLPETLTWKDVFVPIGTPTLTG